MGGFDVTVTPLGWQASIGEHICFVTPCIPDVILIGGSIV
jgi:hypothetical protein